jgi:endoglucanase
LTKPIFSAILISFICNIILAQIPPFRTKGADIIDSEGKVFLIKGVNWWGANGSKFPYSDNHKNVDTHSMPFGLQFQKADTIIKAIKEAGFNTVRLPFSNQLLYDSLKISKDWVGPNVEFTGLTALQVFDIIVKKISDAGIFILLNNHSTTTHWCCNYDYNGLWFGKNKFHSQNTKKWINDWKMLAKRYKKNPYVIAADLRNEVRPMRANFIPLPINPNWGHKNKKDWHRQATKAGNAIHEVNPELLIIVEGINARSLGFVKLQFPHLKPVQKKPIELKLGGKLVYEVHNYSFNWVKANLLYPKKQIRYKNLNREERWKEYDKNWGFVTNKDFEHNAPVLLGEFGCSGKSDDDKEWLRDLTDYLRNKKIGFCWWTLEEDLNDEGSYGIMNPQLNRINFDKDWRSQFLAPLLNQK